MQEEPKLTLSELFNQNSSHRDAFSKFVWFVFSVFFKDSLVFMSNAVHKICALQRTCIFK